MLRLCRSVVIMGKHRGSISDYIEERNHALLAAWRKAMSTADNISWLDVVKKAVEMPAPRFWCSEEQAMCVVRKLLKGQDPNVKSVARREMFEEIHRRVVALRTQNPSLTITDAVFKVVHSPAPQFYLSVKSAYVIIQSAKKKCYEERRRRLRHSLW